MWWVEDKYSYLENQYVAFVCFYEVLKEWFNIGLLLVMSKNDLLFIKIIQHHQELKSLNEEMSILWLKLSQILVEYYA